MDRALIERAIDSARARIYKLSDDEKKNPSAGHQKKIERQKEVMEVTVEALERMMPKKPTDVDEKAGVDYYNLSFMCPACNDAVVCQPYRPNNCKHCGQALDWSE